MVVSSLHPLFGIAIAILILCGTILFGQKLLAMITKESNLISSMGLGMVLISQALYILIISNASLNIIYPIAFCLIFMGIGYIFINSPFLFSIIKTWRTRSKNLISNSYSPTYITLMISYTLLSFTPPTNADGLHYHWGIPVYLMRYQEWPPLNLWLHGNLGGIGEIFNTIGVMLYATNLGTILQSFSLVAFSCYLANRFDGSKRDFIYLYILTSPVLLFLSTTPKPLLFPQVLTALALYITVSEKNINKKLFILICCLLMGAAQQKLSFILTGGVVGFWAFCKAFRKSKFVFIICLVCFIFFFLPRGIWNLEQSSNSGLISFFSPLPYEFIDYLQNFKENNVLVANKGTEIEFEIPNLFLPISLGTITTTVGFQIFLIFFVRTKNKKFWEVTALTLTAMITIYFFGQFTGRYFFEFILWTSVAFSFLNAEEYKFRVYKRFLLVQGFGMLVGVVYGIFTLFPGVLSTDLREEVLHRYASEFSAINWANQILPENSVVLSGLKSVAFFSNDFLPTDWLWFHSNVQTVSSKNKKMRKEYLHAIKLKKPSFLIVNDSLFNKTDFVDCIGEIYSGPKKFNRATRNPFNSGEEYSVTIYRFHSNLLPSCKK